MRTWISNRLNDLLASRLRRHQRHPACQPFEPGKIRQMLIIELGGLGDAVNLFPVLQALHGQLPAVRLTIICRDYVRDLFKLHLRQIPGNHEPQLIPIESVMGISKSAAGLDAACRAVASVKWDVVVSTCWSAWTTALALKLNATYWAGFWRPWRVECFGFEPATIPSVNRGDHLLRLRFKAVAPLGIPTPEHLPPPAIMAAREECDRLRSCDSQIKDDWVGVVPFCQDPGKSLSKTEAERICGQLSDRYARVFLIGGKSERAALDWLAAQRSGCRPLPGHGPGAQLIVAADHDIPHLAALLSYARLVVSVDTGAMHLASALGVPTIGVFKITEPAVCGPLGQRSTTVRIEDTEQPDWLENTCRITVGHASSLSIPQLKERET